MEKLIGASVTITYKDAHLSMGIVWRRDIDQIQWQEILKKHIVELSKLKKGDTMISAPTNGSTGDEWHNVIKVRGLSVRVHRLLYQRYTKSRGHYLRSNNILFTLYPTFHKLNVGIIEVNRGVWVDLFNQHSQLYL